MQAGEKRELLIAEESQEYAQVIRLLGSGRVEANCFSKDDNGVNRVMKRMCTIRGKMRNRVWINAGDIILASLRDETAGDKADVIHKYYPEEAFELQDMEELPANVAINEGVVDEEQLDEGDLVLGDGGGDEEGKNDDLDIDDL